MPSLEELERLTAVPERRVVYRGVDWSFYERLVDSIPETTNIHVDYDGKDLEVMGKGWMHEGYNRLLGTIRGGCHRGARDSVQGPAARRPGNGRRLPEVSRRTSVIYFLPDKLAAVAEAQARGSRRSSPTIPNPDLAIEVDISPPQVDRAGIYAALRVTEVWRFVDKVLVIERLTPQGTYAAVETSGFLPVTAEEVRRWVVDEDSSDESAWARRLRAELKSKRSSGT